MITLKKRKWISAFHEGKTVVFEVRDVFGGLFTINYSCYSWYVQTINFKQKNFLEDSFPLEEVSYA